MIDKYLVCDPPKVLNITFPLWFHLMSYKVIYLSHLIYHHIAHCQTNQLQVHTVLISTTVDHHHQPHTDATHTSIILCTLFRFNLAANHPLVHPGVRHPPPPKNPRKLVLSQHEHTRCSACNSCIFSFNFLQCGHLGFSAISSEPGIFENPISKCPTLQL